MRDEIIKSPANLYGAESKDFVMLSLKCVLMGEHCWFPTACRSVQEVSIQDGSVVT